MNNYMLLIMAAFLIVFMMWTTRSRKKQMEKMEQDKRDQLAAVTPGEWVRTRWGFWGRFVDLDGDIVVLETSDGHEMYWERFVIAEIGGQPPWARPRRTWWPRHPMRLSRRMRMMSSSGSTTRTRSPLSRTPTSSRSNSRLNGK